MSGIKKLHLNTTESISNGQVGGAFCHIYLQLCFSTKASKFSTLIHGSVIDFEQKQKHHEYLIDTIWF